MEPEHPIDGEIRTWLDKHVDNQSALSEAIGRSSSWLHKYINGAGHATIDDLVRMAALLMGLNLPVLSERDRRLLKVSQGLTEADHLEVIAYAELRTRLARRGGSTESSAPVAQTPPATRRIGRGKR